MGCSLSFFQKAATKLIDKRVLILGLDNAGKSCLFHQLKEQKYRDTAPTIGLNVETIVLEHFQISLWDVGGQATLLWKHYYEDTDAIIFVVDLSEKARLDLVKAEMEKLIQESSLVNCPILIIGNKIDVPEHINDDELLSCLDYAKIEKLRKLKYAKISAKTGEGIKEFKAIMLQYFDDANPVKTEQIKDS